MEQQRRQSVSQMPLDVVGKHAQENMGAHSFWGPVADWPDFEIDGLQTAEGALHPRQILVGLDGLVGVEIGGRDIGANDIDAVETRLVLDLLGAPPEGQMAISDLDCEVLGHFLLVDHGADRQTDLGGSLEARACAFDLGFETAEAALCYGQKLLALARTFCRKLAIAADNQPLAREHLG